ncbi:MAG: dienelactone hydrolase family protein [Candidatus Binatus sp.]
MIEEAIEIRTSDGNADGILFRAEGERRPGVIHLTDIGGIRPSHREMAKRLAEKGYTVLMPNVFYRTTKPPVIDVKIGMGDPKTMQRFGELRAPLTPEAVERDATAYVNFLTAHAATSAGKIGVVGYCFTGAFAMRTAAAMPGKVAAMASFHGGGLYTDEPTSPHLVLPRIKARLYFGHATNDRTCRRRRSKSSIERSPHGAENMKAKSTKARSTVGRHPMRRSTTRRKPNARSRN